jgi:dTDP-4-amino-4,6-dideoxygalactose transaminase
MSENTHVINVTKTYLPPLEEYMRYLERTWSTNQLTNNGPLVQELETKLKEFLGVKHLYFVSNGTIALQIAIKALDLHGEIITTPFSYVATTSSIIWEGCQPVFVDIDPETLNINPDLIEPAITSRTTAILPVHVYGFPCDVESIQRIADRYKLKVFYDAAHAFGVGYKGQSLLNHGDITTLSFHATKLFHTAEGGALITNDDEVAHRIGYLRNFGHKGQEEFWGLGINGKNSEIQAAMGLCVLSKVPELIAIRAEISELYDRLLRGCDLVQPKPQEKTMYNFAYFPVLFPNEAALLEVQNALQARQVFTRRYFYPSLNTLSYVYTSCMPVSEDVAKRVLCLPLSHCLESQDIQLITETIRMTVTRN